MHHTRSGSRWTTPHRRYTGFWRENPWINAALSHSRTSPYGDAEERQQRAAMRVWENEGGSLGAQRSTADSR